jgi:Protein involved in formate dehydrogenase formation
LRAAETSPSTRASPWAARRQRAEVLRDRHSFTSEVLTLYLALLSAQEDAWNAAHVHPPAPEGLAPWAAARVVPAVVDATVAAGPAALGEAARGRLATGTVDEALTGWLAGGELDPVDRYLARASLTPVLEALGERAGAMCAPMGDGEGDQLCPRCGGRPQLSCVASSGESLVSGPRSLLCARCSSTWSCARSRCPACGESDDSRLVVHAEKWARPGNGNGKDTDQPMFPQLRIAGCSTCNRYLIEVDMARDARAVPEVDELAAIPLDLYASEEGLTKVTPNLMGF